MTRSIVTAARLAAAGAVAAASLATAGAQSAIAAEPSFGHLYLNGIVVGTVIPPAHVEPGSGRDPFYEVTNGATGQLGIAGVGPGQGEYHGGDWEVFTVAFNAGHTPYLLTSAAAVASAATAGDVMVKRQPGQDFRCPITAG
ncbi:hypothetical protein EPN29_10975 [bacterium]|nr:MAG: hypothetical protein EPN29_10975 [bacterium]